MAPMPIDAVVFDLDGVLVDSERVWAAAREELTLERGGTYGPDATRAMQGMSSLEWSGYIHDELGVDLPPEEISRQVVERLEKLYRDDLPLISGARDAVASLAARWPLGLASSANREIIELVLDLSEMRGLFAATVSSEEVPRGKPAPDVYLEAARRIGVQPEKCAAVEDSSNGLRSAAAAGMTLIAFPNREYPPAEDTLAPAQAVIQSLDELRPELLDRLGRLPIA
jgi:HAD superfamily hydrolase (TIGR01509 family)